MDYQRPRLRWYTYVADFANTMKAFLGSNYLTISYAFKQSGLVLGIIELLLIAVLTDHCCHLIVRSKYFALKNKILRSEEENQSPSTNSNCSDNHDDTKVLLENETFHNLTYGDIANLAFGKIGLYIVNACIFFTQYGFCVVYFIFVGNSIYNFFPYKRCHVSFSNASVEDICVQANISLTTDSVLTVSDHLSVNGSSTYIPQGHVQTTHEYPSSLGELISEQLSNMTELLLSMPTAAKTTEAAVVIKQNATAATSVSTTLVMSTTSPALSLNWTHLNDTILMSTSPPSKYLVLVPLPILILFAFIRNVRHIGIVSATANICILTGCVFVFIFLLIDFSVSIDYELYDLRNSLMFFGMVTTSYEGIGCIIPIESSMKGNRHNFPLFLHGTIIFLTFVLLLFGVLGYLRFGQHVAQMLNINILPGSVVSLIVNVCLCMSVLLTFPLQLVPVIQLMEIYIFGDGRLCGPRKRRYVTTTADSDMEHGDIPEDYQMLMSKSSTDNSISTLRSDSDQVATWKRNLLRTFIVLSAAGFGVLFRNSFAYALGFIGSIGCTTIGYIMPSLIHTKLGGASLKRSTRLKNYMIFVVGIVCGVSSLCTIVIELVKQTSV